MAKLADLIVLNSNPLDEIRHSADLALVMRGGVLYETDTLVEVKPDVYLGDDRPTDCWDRIPP